MKPHDDVATSRQGHLWEHIASQLDALSGNHKSILMAGLVILIVTILSSELLKPGPVFVGDYVATNSISPVNQVVLSYSPLLYEVRNGGFGWSVYQFRWASMPYTAIEAVFSVATGSNSYAKLSGLFYLDLGALGMFVLVRKLFLLRQKPSSTWMSLAGVIAVLYVANPGVVQVMVKGYWNGLETLGLLPWLMLSYWWFTTSSRRRDFLVRGGITSLVIFAAIDYTYPVLAVAIIIGSFELFSTADPTLQRRGLSRLLRLAYVLSLVAAWEVPTFYLVSHTTSSQFSPTLDLHLSDYYAVNQFSTPLSVVTLTSSSNIPSFLQTLYPGLWLAFAAGMVVLLALTLVLYIGRRSSEDWSRRSVCIYASSVVVALGPLIPLNVFVYRIIPYFYETQEFLPLLAFSFFLFVSEELSSVQHHPLRSLRPPNSQTPRRLKVRTFQLVGVRCMALVIVFLVLVGGTSLHIATSTAASPTTDIPAYEQTAYQWLRDQPGPGRMLLIPPSYSNTYPYNKGVYSAPIDPWTITPPRPIIIVGDQTLGTTGILLSQALYQGNSTVFASLLTSLGVEFVVLRHDAISTYNVPYYWNISVNFINSHFNFLSDEVTFGGNITVWRNTDYSGLFQAFKYPIVMNGSINTLSSIAEFTSPDSPIVFTNNLPISQVSEIERSFGVPAIDTCTVLPCSSGGGSSLHLLPFGGFDSIVLSNPGLPYAGVTLSENSSLSAFSLSNLGAPFSDTYSDVNYTNSHWKFFSSTPIVGGNRLSLSATRLGGASLEEGLGLTNFSFSCWVSVESGSGGIYLGTNSGWSPGYLVILQPLFGNGAVQIQSVSNGIGTTVAVVATPISFGNRYLLTEEDLNGRLVVDFGSNEIFSGPWNGNLSVPGLFVSGGTTSYTDASEQNLTLSPLPVGEPDRVRNQTAYVIRVSTTGRSLFESPRVITGLTLGTTTMNPILALNPPLVPLTVENGTSWGEWRVDASLKNLSFLVIRYVDLPGWQSAPSLGCFAISGYGLGCIFNGTVTISFQSDYTNLAVGTTFGIISMIALSLVILLSSWLPGGQKIRPLMNRAVVLVRRLRRRPITSAKD